MLRAGEATPSARAEVETITLEHGCFGCADASTLVLRRDGLATLTVHGNARQGTQERALHGRIDRQAFDALGRLAAAQGFFALSDSYEDPQLRDGAWTTTVVARGAQEKRVFTREDAAPESLKRLTTAIERARDAIAFEP